VPLPAACAASPLAASSPRGHCLLLCACPKDTGIGNDRTFGLLISELSRVQLSTDFLPFIRSCAAYTDPRRKQGSIITFRTHRSHDPEGASVVVNHAHYRCGFFCTIVDDLPLLPLPSPVPDEIALPSPCSWTVEYF